MNKLPLFSLHSTNNYVNFNFYKHNRALDKRNLQVLEMSIKKHGLKHPIVVDKDGYIIDGQHRFTVLKKLRRAIWYVVNNYTSLEDIEIVNNDRKDWTTQTRIENLADLGNQDCIRLLELQKEHIENFSLGTINEVYNSNQTSVSTSLKKKTYQINEDFGDTILDYCLTLKEFTEDEKYLSSKFVRALKKVVSDNQELFNFNLLQKNINKKKLHIYNNEKDIIEEIKEVHDYKKKNNKLS